MRVNTLGEAVSQTVATGTASSRDIEFATGLALQSLEVASGAVTVEGLGAIKEGVSKEEAEEAKEKIEAAGGTVELK